MTSNLPTGTVTFLFTDIEGSTRLWEQQPDAMQAALARHDGLLRSNIETHGGHVVKTTGDGLHAVFAQASESLAATLACQQALARETWADLPHPLRVRMGLHTGEAEFRDGDYFGPALNRAARLMSIASGGQTLLSAATIELVRDQLPPGATLHDLGEHRLKYLARPEHVFQLTGPGLPTDFPPLRSLNTLPNNLPVQLTSFIGREHEMAEVKRLLSTTRLLTLTGPGGTGKTRLSLQAMAEVLEQFADGVWLVELAPLADPALIAQAAAAVLGVREFQGRSLLEALTDYLRHKRLLLILDNCEHLVEACSQLVHHLLTACPNLKIIASSREVLGIAGETVLRVPSLALPEAGHATPETLAHCESARLFVERAQAHLNGFAVTEHNASAIAQICQRLDGIPLALELAAVRVNLLNVEQIAARLDDRFRLLTGGSRTALPRQQTLRALIDWSWELLSEPERALLRHLSVFAGGWTLKAAEAVAPAQAERAVDVLDVLAQLDNKSLVVVEREQSVEARYRLLETIRQYAREKLVEAGEAVSARNRHLDFYLALAEAAEPKLIGPEMVTCLDQLEVEQDNLRATLQWAFENDPLAALRLVAVLHVFWGRRASTTEGYTLVKTALVRAEAAFQLEPEAPPAYLTARAKALVGKAVLAFQLGDNLSAKTAIEASLSLARQINASRTLAFALFMGATICGFMGEVDKAQAWAEEAMGLCRQNGYAYELAMLSPTPLFMAFITNQPVPPGLPEEVIRVARASDNPWALGMAIFNVGQVAMLSGHWAEAYQRFAESATLFQQMRDRPMYNASRADLGHVLRKQGRLPEALAVYRETILVWQELGQRAAIARTLECFAFVAGAQEQNERAAKLLGAAQALRELIDSSMTSLEHLEYDQAMSQLRVQMDEAALAKAWAEGRGMGMEQALELAEARC